MRFICNFARGHGTPSIKLEKKTSLRVVGLGKENFRKFKVANKGPFVSTGWTVQN